MKFAITLLIAAAFCSTAIAGDAVWVSSLDVGKAVQGYGQPRANAACNGGPISIRGRQFAHGFGTHAVSDLYIELHGAGQTFSAWVGVDDDAKGGGKVTFEVIGDGKTLWTSGSDNREETRRGQPRSISAA